MSAAIIGPICKDDNIVRGKSYSHIGGVTYYAGMALASLGFDVTIFGTFGRESKDWLKPLEKCKVVRIPAEGTLKFVNEYPNESSDYRVQRAEICDNAIAPEHIAQYDVEKFDCIVLGPLIQGNIGKPLVQELRARNRKAKLFLAASGLLRLCEKGKIVWKLDSELMKVLPLVDYVLLDEDELKFITGRDSVKSAAGFLHAKGVKNLLVTMGSRGSIIFKGSKSYSIPAFSPSSLVDPTGAGDTYLAGFIKSLELFKDAKEQGEFAAMTATIGIEAKGAFNKNAGYVLRMLAKEKS